MSAYWQRLLEVERRLRRLDHIKFDVTNGAAVLKQDAQVLSSQLSGMINGMNAGGFYRDFYSIVSSCEIRLKSALIYASSQDGSTYLWENNDSAFLWFKSTDNYYTSIYSITGSAGNYDNQYLFDWTTATLVSTQYNATTKTTTAVFSVTYDDGLLFLKKSVVTILFSHSSNSITVKGNKQYGFDTEKWNYNNLEVENVYTGTTETPLASNTTGTITLGSTVGNTSKIIVLSDRNSNNIPESYLGLQAVLELRWGNNPSPT